MIIRPATPGDLAAIATIQSSAPEAAQWNPADYLQYDCLVADVLQVDNLRPVVNRPENLKGRLPTGRRLPTWPPSGIVAFLVTRQTAPDEREILNLAVDPAHRRKGIGRALLHGALTHAPCDWYLEVRESNTAAIRLYESLGFERLALREKYYSDSSESGIVMKLRS